jgi:hypothetical protein
MAYQQTSATDYDDLLDKLVTFAVADGWTQSYNAAGPPRQIGIYKDNCHISWGARSGENPISRGGSQYDAFINGALATALLPGSPQYWGHTDSIVTTDTDPDRIRVNDLYGSLTNVWFFSGGVGDMDYIHVVVQAGGERYTHFGFGILDSLGQTHPNTAFACGGYYEWWDASTNCHNPESTYHEFGHLADENYAHIRIMANTLPSGYPAAGVYRTLNNMTLVMTRANADADHWAASIGKIMDFVFPVGNQLTTGGNILYSIPWLFQEAGSVSHVWLGRLPGMRIANIAQHSPGATLTQGTDEWLIFPWKRKGLKENLYGAGDPIQECNTAEYAWAYKKNT